MKKIQWVACLIRTMKQFRKLTEAETMKDKRLRFNPGGIIFNLQEFQKENKESRREEFVNGMFKNFQNGWT